MLTVVGVMGVINGACIMCAAVLLAMGMSAVHREGTKAGGLILFGRLALGMQTVRLRQGV